MADEYRPPPPSAGQWPPPPPPPPAGQWQSAQPVGQWQSPGYYQPAPQLGSGMQVTSIVAGIFGVLCGLIPLFFLGAWAFGLSALVVGIMAYRKAKAVGQHQGRAGIILGSIAIVLGVVGIVIVAGAFDELDDDLTCIEEADTSAEIEACND